MADKRCRFALREHMDLFLGVKNNYDPLFYQSWTVSANDEWGIDWIVSDIAGTNSKFLIKSGGLGSGFVLHWNRSGLPALIMKYAERERTEFCSRFMELDGGYTAINNHDETHVLDRNDQNGSVVCFTWNGGDNQQWVIQEL